MFGIVFSARRNPSSDGKKDAAIYLRHMLEAIDNIETDTADFDFVRFRVDRRTRQLVERNLEILSEAGRRLPKQLKEGEPLVPWRAIAGIGNVLRHEYHDTYPTVLWDTCKKDLKPLKEAVVRMTTIVASAGLYVPLTDNIMQYALVVL